MDVKLGRRRKSRKGRASWLAMIVKTGCGTDGALDITRYTAPGVPQARGDVPRVHAAALQRVRQAAAPAQEAHRQRHRGGGLPGGQHALQVVYHITYI